MKPGYFLPYAKQSIYPEDIAEVTKALQADLITRGPKVEEFENALAQYCGARYAVAFNSGTSALLAACHAAQFSVHDRIITTPNTFIGTIAGSYLKKSTPTFIDIDARTGNIDLENLDLNLNRPSSRGRDILMPVHFAGVPVDMQKVEAMIRHPHTLVIEDAAHALGSSYADGQKVGSCPWSQMTIFSFHPAKQLTTGEGGMVTTNDEDLYHRLTLFRNNGIERDPRYLKEEPAPWFYEVQEITGNFNFTDFQAALGLSQLRRIDHIVAKRQQLLSHYQERLNQIPHLEMLSPQMDPNVSYHLCVVLIDFETLKLKRQDVMNRLKDAGIGSQVHYIPLYRHPAIAKMCGDIAEYFPNMETYYSRALSLPLHCEMEENDVEYVCETLSKIMKG